MTSNRARWWAAPALLALALSALAQTAPPAELAAAQLRAARELERDGQVDAARQAYTKLLEADPKGTLAPEALLGLGRLLWPVDDPRKIGSVPVDPKAMDEARADFERVANEFKASRAAPEALWRLALLRLEPGSSNYDVEQALAALTTVAALYPDAADVPEALALAVRLHLDAGRLARARGLAFTLLARWPTHPIAARAWLVLALADAREGRIDDALTEAGSARRVAQGVDAVAGDEALALATLLDRRLHANARGARPFEFDRTPGPVFASRPRSIAAAPDGRLALAVPGDDKLLTLQPGSAAPESRDLPGVTAVAFDRWGRLWTAGGGRFGTPQGVPAPTFAERTDIVALAPAGPRSVWVADARGKRVLLLQAGGGVAATARLPERANPIALASDGAGGAWVLDARGNALIEIGEDGVPKRNVSLANLAKDPVAIDTDILGDVYVLDADAPALLVLGRDGQLAVRQPFPTDGDDALSKPTALAVTRSGSVAVFDGKRKKIQWLR